MAPGTSLRQGQQIASQELRSTGRSSASQPPVQAQPIAPVLSAVDPDTNP